MSARSIRRVVIAVCVAGIAGMVAASITDHIGVAITSGAMAAIAVLCLILVTAAAGPSAFGAARSGDDDAAADLEHRVEHLVAAGAEEADVRSLVRAAVRFGRKGP